ncbi:hypothetical protein TWF718_005866 [Orbilia javanica]|uniref:Uncharacterized protein n=1 Tax=Orbilia javanica TaxID=47235 RepID=A0AAN8N283_9PEZI
MSHMAPNSRYEFELDVEPNRWISFHFGHRSSNVARNNHHSGRTVRSVSTRRFDTSGNQTHYRRELMESSSDGHFYRVWEQYPKLDNAPSAPRGFIEEIPSHPNTILSGDEEEDPGEEVEKSVCEKSRYSHSLGEGGSHNGGYTSFNFASVPGPSPASRPASSYSPSYSRSYSHYYHSQSPKRAPRQSRDPSVH